MLAFEDAASMGRCSVSSPHPADTSANTTCLVGGGRLMGSGGVAQTGGGWDHGCRSFVDGVDDLGVVDPPQVGGCDPEVSMTELPLDDYQRDAFAGHLDCVSVAELVRREPSPDAGRPSGVSQQRADPGRRAGTAAGGSTEHAEQRADRQPRANLQPRLELLPGPTVHSNLAPL